MAKYYVGQTLQLKLDTNDSDIGTASAKQIWITQPDGSILKKTATVTDSTYLTYTLTATETTTGGAGGWRAQNYAEFAGSVVKFGDTFKFELTAQGL